MVAAGPFREAERTGADLIPKHIFEGTDLLTNKAATAPCKLGFPGESRAVPETLNGIRYTDWMMSAAVNALPAM